MSDYLKNLAARTLDPSTVVQPRLASRFEPPPGEPGLVTDFEVETEFEASPAEPPVEARAETPHAPVTTRAESAPRVPAEHSPPPVFERRPEVSPHEQSPAPASERAPDPAPSQTFVNRETPRQTAANVEVLKSAAREETAESVPAAVRAAARPSPEAAEPQTTRSGPRVVEPRLLPAPKVSEAPQSRASFTPEPAHEDAAPTIRVTIGRVDVRAVAAGSKETKRAPAPPRPALTLEDYLRRRGGGSR